MLASTNKLDESKIHQNSGGIRCDDNKTSLNESIIDKQQYRHHHYQGHHHQQQQQQHRYPQQSDRLQQQPQPQPQSQSHRHQLSPTATISTTISTTDSGVVVYHQPTYPNNIQRPSPLLVDNNSIPLKKHTDFPNFSGALGLRGRPANTKQLSSDDSWCIPSSDQDFSSDEDTEKNALSPFRFLLTIFLRSNDFEIYRAVILK